MSTSVLKGGEGPTMVLLHPGVKRTMRQVAKVGLTGSIPEGDLAKISMPVALIWGRRDPPGPRRSASGERLSARLGWPIRMVEDAGHLPHVEQPEAFVDALRAALGRD